MPPIMWTLRPMTNCWTQGNGARSDLEEPEGSAAFLNRSVAECKAACLHRWPVRSTSDSKWLFTCPNPDTSQREADLTDCTALVHLGLAQDCEAIVFSHNQGCYRRAGIELVHCRATQGFDMYLLESVLPPPQPSAPLEAVPDELVARGVDAINERFRRGRPSNRPEEVMTCVARISVSNCTHKEHARAFAVMYRAKCGPPRRAADLATDECQT